MDEQTILHGLKDIMIEVADLHARINAVEKKLEKCKTLQHICACEECDCEDIFRETI